MIRLEGVTKVYRTANGPVHALSGIDLEVPSGQFLVVRGPSGSGKSTLLSIIGGLGSPTTGRVVVAGSDMATLGSAMRARFRAEHIGFVFQTFHLLPYLTVVENVALATSRGGESAGRQYAAEVLQRCQLGHRLTHRPAELSTGECQRAAIARALMNRPRLILADEPTGNLDPENAAIVLDLLASFRREGGTVLVVTHQDRAVQFADRTIYLQGGAVASG